MSSVESWFDSSVCPRKNVIFLWFSTGNFRFVFVVVACLCISDKLCDIQSIVRKTRDRISLHYLSPKWRLLDRIAKFASTISNTGARYTNSMGRRLTFCAISALKENLHAPFPFVMRLWRSGTPKVISARCTQYNIMWWSLSVTCNRSMVLSRYSSFLLQ